MTNTNRKVFTRSPSQNFLSYRIIINILALKISCEFGLKINLWGYDSNKKVVASGPADC